MAPAGYADIVDYTTTIAAVCAGSQEDMFLSKSVLMELGIVHDTFPKVIKEKVNISQAFDRPDQGYQEG